MYVNYVFKYDPTMQVAIEISGSDSHYQKPNARFILTPININFFLPPKSVSLKSLSIMEEVNDA